MKLNQNLASNILWGLFGPGGSASTTSTSVYALSGGQFGSGALYTSNNTGSGSLYIKLTPTFSNKEVYLGLWVGDPLGNPAGTELSGHGYKRKNIYDTISQTYQSYSLGQASAQNNKSELRIGNASQIVFEEAVRSTATQDAPGGGRWKFATHWGLCSTETGDTVYLSGSIDEPVSVDTHQVFTIRNGHFEILLSNGKTFVYRGTAANLAAFKSNLNSFPLYEVAGYTHDLHIDGQDWKPAGYSITRKLTDSLYFGSPSTPAASQDYSGVVGATDKYYVAASSSFTESPMFLGNGYTSEYDDGIYSVYYSTIVDANITTSFYNETSEGSGAETVFFVLKDSRSAYNIYEVDPKRAAPGHVIRISSASLTQGTQYYYQTQCYVKVASPTGNPSTNNYYENPTPNVFVKSADTSVVIGKHYYTLETRYYQFTAPESAAIAFCHFSSQRVVGTEKGSVPDYIVLTDGNNKQISGGLVEGLSESSSAPAGTELTLPSSNYIWII